jgi:Putative integrase
MTENTFIACEKSGGGWVNTDLAKFAIVPGLDEPVAATEAIVEESLRVFAEHDDGDTKDEVLAELLELHARGLILWPLGFLWGRSMIGDIFGQRFYKVVAEEDPVTAEVRKHIFDSEEFQSSNWKDAERQNRSFIFWRLFITLRLASSDVKTLGDLQEAHLVRLFNVLKPNGLWLDWVPAWTKKHLLYFADFLGRQREQPLFAIGHVNPMRPTSTSRRTTNVVATHPHLGWVDEAFENWADTLPSMTKGGPRDAKRLFLDFMSTRPATDAEPRSIFSRGNMKALLEFGKTWGTSTGRGLSVAKVHDFAYWFADKHPDAKVEVGINRYDVDQFLKSIPTSGAKAGDVKARPMPARFHHTLKEIITENDFAWPKSLVHGATGKPVHWISWLNPATNEVEPVFCEVLPRMLLLHLELPLRNIQVRRLDSGEGDSRYYDAKSRTWHDAVGANTDYWKRAGAKNLRRGVFREIPSLNGDTITGFWVNSNKTQDAVNLFDEMSGYEIPWQHDEVLENLAAMRAWQEKHNPVAGPLPYASMPPGIFDDEPSELVRAVLPDRFYLFRYPQNAAARGNEAPPSYFVFHQFFHDALDELERRLAAEDPESAVRIITERDRSGQPRKAIFTIHGMRSSTLTSLHLAGVPIEVLSKVVAGHATILMTLRYTKFDAAHVNDILTQARMQVVAAGRNQFANFLQNATLEQAMRMTARLSDDGLHQIKGPYDEPTGWSRLEVGICPNGCTQCHIGGEAIANRRERGKDKSIYGPVPGGARNCVRCRFFVTGLPFLIPLWAHATAILARVDSLSKNVSSVRLELDELKRQRLALDGSPVPQSLTDRIRILDETWVGECDARDQALADAHATMVLVEKIRAIFKHGAGEENAKLPMLLNDDCIPEVTARESTRFEIVDAVVQASRWFPSMNTSDLERERNEFLDKILYRNGYVPITLLPLSEQERRRAADALAQMVIVELGAAEAQNLIEGKKTLADFGLQEKLEAAAARAVGHPIDRLALPAPSPARSVIDVQAEGRS